MIGYSQNLALIHEEGFAALARDAAVLLVEQLQRGHFPRGLIVDIGCGGGAFENVVIGRGYAALGIDLSASMLRLARRREPRARYRRQSWTKAAFPSCVAITAIGECLCYAFDGEPSDGQLRSFMQRAYGSLAAGGILMFDLLTTLPIPERREVWVEHPDGRWAVHVHVSERRGSKVVVRRITSFRKTGRLYRRTDEVHEQRRFAAREIVRMLRKTGFRVRVLHSYGRSIFREGHTGFIAQKPVH